jgi:hypothetical protein
VSWHVDVLEFTTAHLADAAFRVTIGILVRREIVVRGDRLAFTLPFTISFALGLALPLSLVFAAA